VRCVEFSEVELYLCLLVGILYLENKLTVPQL
jgi:hypothetical protein